jgi:hypothetical protein
MPRIKLSDLSGTLRLELTQPGKDELWHRVDEFGGVKKFAEGFEYSQSKIYNWKSKDLALPVNFVRRVMGENNTDEIVTLKGPGSSGKIENPNFPLEISEELLTRVRFSVKENSDGTPIYITQEKSLAERFSELLEKPGEVEYKIYSRDSRFELRYPKFLHELFLGIDFEEDLGALVILLEDREIPVKDFDEEIFSREKNFELALEKGDSEKITRLMAEESSKVRNLVGSQGN